MFPKKQNIPPAWVSIMPVITSGILLSLASFKYNSSPHIPIFICLILTGVLSLLYGYSWQTIKDGMIESVSKAIPALIILLIIGMIIGSWIASGIVPALIYYGFNFLKPDFFLPSTLILCSIMSLITGSSWTTVGTMGIACIGIGLGLDLPAPAIAGAVVSGAFFGDKMSPLSDSTNLTPSIVGVELYTHIKHMLYTTVPSFILSLIAYIFIGKSFITKSSYNGDNIIRYQQILTENFSLSPLLFIPPVVVLIMIVFKTPAIPSLTIGVALGSIMQIFVQGHDIQTALTTLYKGYTIETGWDKIDNLLSRGGMTSMYSTVSLGIISLAFGGVMKKCDMLLSLVKSLARFLTNKGSLILTTLLSSVSINIFGANQYLAIIIPAQMFENSYKRLNLHLKNLTRALEDAGTLTAPLIPWNSSGIFMFTVLSVNPLAFAPYAILCWLSTLVEIVYGYTGFTIDKSALSEESTSF